MRLQEEMLGTGQIQPSLNWKFFEIEGTKLKRDISSLALARPLSLSLSSCLSYLSLPLCAPLSLCWFSIQHAASSCLTSRFSFYKCEALVRSNLSYQRLLFRCLKFICFREIWYFIHPFFIYLCIRTNKIFFVTNQKSYRTEIDFVLMSYLSRLL